MQNELPVKKVSIQTCHLAGGAIMFSSVSGFLHVILSFTWKFSSEVSMLSGDAERVLKEAVPNSDGFFSAWSVNLCTVAKSSCPVLSWTSGYVFPAPPFLVLALGMGRRIHFCLSRDFSLSGLWFPVGSAGQFGPAPDPVMIGTTQESDGSVWQGGSRLRVV